MGEVKNLFDNDGVETLKFLVEEIKICMFCSNLSNLPVDSRPMSVYQVDNEGNIWFISSKQSNKNFQINNDAIVQLFFTSTSDTHYLSVFGNVTVYKNIEEVDKIFNPIANAWFEESLNDNSVIAIKVKPENTYFWDSNENKVSINLNSKKLEYSKLKLN